MFQFFNFKLSATHLWILEGEPKWAVSKLRTFGYEEKDARAAVEITSLAGPGALACLLTSADWVVGRRAPHLIANPVLLAEGTSQPADLWISSFKGAQGGIPSATAACAESSLIWSLWNTAFLLLMSNPTHESTECVLTISVHEYLKAVETPSTQLKWALCDLILKCAERSLGCLWGQWALLGLHCFGNRAEIWLCELCFMLLCVQNLSPVFKDARQEENPFWVSEEKIHKDVKRQTLVSERYWILEFF